MNAVRIEGYKRRVPQALIERVWDLAASGMKSTEIGHECGISPKKAKDITSMVIFGRANVVASGADAEPGTKCPFSESEIGLRCAWLAGHYDKHGKDAWSKAR